MIELTTLDLRAADKIFLRQYEAKRGDDENLYDLLMITLAGKLKAEHESREPDCSCFKTPNDWLVEAKRYVAK